MNDLECLLAAIIANPDEDDPRLRYADALQERNAPADLERAEFIRLELEPLGAESDVPRLMEQVRLLNAHRGRFQEDMPPIGLPWEFYLSPQDGVDARWAVGMARGFGEVVTLPGGDWVAHGDAIRRRLPVREVQLTSLPAAREQARPPDVHGNRLFEWRLDDDPRPDARFAPEQVFSQRLFDLPDPWDWALAVCRLRWRGINFVMGPMAPE